MGIFDQLTKEDLPQEVQEKKPAIFSDNRSDAERFDPKLHRGSLDPSRVPGYSEVVQANDIAPADALYFREANAGRTKEDIYKQIGAAPRELPVELAWLPAPDTGSSAQRRQLDQYTMQQGFRLVKGETVDGAPALPRHLRDLGYGFLGTWRLAEDGSVRRGPDTALYWRSGEVAQMWKADKAEKQAAFEGSRDPKTFDASTSFYNERDQVETVTVKH